MAKQTIEGGCAEKPESVSEKLLLSFNEQFATNQNHHQVVFLQFLSAILVVLIGYGYVYANTGIDVCPFELLRAAKDGAIISYSIMDLFGSYIISQFILTLMITVVVNIGYGFRRDQNVIFKIRKEYFGNDYIKYFGRKSYDPSNLNLIDYLPEFNRMFFIGIFCLHILLFCSFGFSVSHFKSFDLFGICPKAFWFICLFPIFWSIWLYLNYYKKYYWIMTDSDRFWLKDIFKRKEKRNSAE